MNVECDNQFTEKDVRKLANDEIFAKYRKF